METIKCNAAEIDLTDDSGIRPKSIFDYISKQAGGTENLGPTRQDQKNYLRTKRQCDLSYGEASSLLMYFEKQTRINASCTYTLQLDGEEKITNTFWVDPKMLIDYTHFGDVISFDTTFCTNKEYRPYSVFVGFNHHRGISIFGAALLYDETSESFKWLFEAFPEAHGQKKPLTVFTDQDSTIGNAISEVFPDTWHVFKHFERVVNDKCYNELKAEFDARNKISRNIFPMSPVMRQALEVYTPIIFEQIQDEHLWISTCYIKYRDKSVTDRKYIVAIVDKEGDFNVTCNPSGPTIACSCRRFETFGILYCHALKILDDNNIKFIPATYVLRRWTRGTRNMIVDQTNESRIEEDVNLDCTQCYRLLCPILVMIASEALNSIEGYALVNTVAKDLLAQLQNIVVDAPLHVSLIS
ncbi:protein FAR-RED IMPAIRED RESPONSE 1-like [Macadamia integrifolia]|uniref:protein FAR-RED IMPAIRED RESPONSE 1-like n=1 Tax=Macadamia integrifolia TaxID=60698 RepID=UPI001C53394C|nr:protein FAR-RED IMPAIRED RESPONSE 1-like [Macadamia integrifolia]